MIITISLKKPEDDKTLNIMVEERQTIRNTLTELEKADFLLHREPELVLRLRPMQIQVVIPGYVDMREPQYDLLEIWSKYLMF